MSGGDDDLLFGQPHDLEEAAETLIEFYGGDRLRSILKDGTCLYDSKPLYAIAQFIRNHWFLWWHPNHDSNDYPVSKPPLLAFFHGIGITHPDDMSDILFASIWHRFQNKFYDLEETVEALQEYWKEQGYPDGKPDINAL